MYYLCTSVGFCGLTLLHIFSITPHVFLPPCLTTLVGQNAAGLVVDVLGSGSQETHRKRARLWKYVEVFGWEWGTPPKIMFQSIVLKRKLMTQPRPTHLPFLPSFTFFFGGHASDHRSFELWNMLKPQCHESCPFLVLYNYNLLFSLPLSLSPSREIRSQAEGI